MLLLCYCYLYVTVTSMLLFKKTMEGLTNQAERGILQLEIFYILKNTLESGYLEEKELGHEEMC